MGQIPKQKLRKTGFSWNLSFWQLPLKQRNKIQILFALLSTFFFCILFF